MRNKNEDLRLKGLPRYLNKLVMLVLLPLRKPLLVLPILFLMYIVPTFIGARPSEVHLWYLDKIKFYSADLSDKTKSILPDLDISKLPPQLGGRALPENSIEKVVNLPQRENRRRSFEKIKSTSQDVVIKKDILRAEPVIAPTVKTIINNNVVETQPQKETLKKKLNLVYLSTPKIISGVARVVNANEIEVNGVPMFLYGIYADPLSSSGIDGMIYLERIIGRQDIECEVIAYTYQDVATAICSFNGANINKTMVEKGYSKNVALD